MLDGVLDGRQGTNDTLVVRDLVVRVQGNIEIDLEMSVSLTILIWISRGASKFSTSWIILTVLKLVD